MPPSLTWRRLAGLGWPQAGEQIKAFLALRDFNAVEAFCDENGVGNEGGRSYFFSKETLVVWTMMNRWTWRDRGIRMNCVSPGPVETPILPDFLETLGERAEEDAKDHGSSGTTGRYRAGHRLYVQRRQRLDQGRQHPLRRRHVSTCTL